MLPELPASELSKAMPPEVVESLLWIMTEPPNSEEDPASILLVPPCCEEELPPRTRKLPPPLSALVAAITDTEPPSCTAIPAEIPTDPDLYPKE